MPLAGARATGTAKRSGLRWGESMIVHIDKLIRHLRNQIDVADRLQSEFVYITKREAEACLELAEAQEVIQETYQEIKEVKRNES